MPYNWLMNFLKTSLLICLALLQSATAFGASAELVQTRLSGYEWDVSMHEWHADSNTIRELTSIVEDPAEMRFVRGRALVVLSSFDSKLAADSLVRLTDLESLGALRRRAADELCVSKGSNEDQVVAAMIRLLAVEDDVLRVRAASCLRRFDNVENAQKALIKFDALAAQWELMATGKQDVQP